MIEDRLPLEAIGFCEVELARAIVTWPLIYAHNPTATVCEQLLKQSVLKNDREKCNENNAKNKTEEF